MKKDRITDLKEYAMTKLQYDLNTANEMLKEAFELIQEIKDILNDTDMDDQEALQNIDYAVRTLRKLK
jgi:hypothetical protein